MILFSNAKINLGLQILRKREDGFHDICSVFYPIHFHDIIEIHLVKDKRSGFSFTQSGLAIPGKISKNLCYRAWEVFSKRTGELSVRMHLHKRIPMGSGLGGGSSNGAFVLKALNELKGAPLSVQQLAELAAEIGSDCPFFIRNEAALVEGRGEILKNTNIRVEGFLVLLHPVLNISTAEAYRAVQPDAGRLNLEQLLSEPEEKWKSLVKNDFEKSIFKSHPLIKDLKEALYQSGAFYASMTGSGSAVYGLFKSVVNLPDDIHKYIAWQGSI
jgi:4-diphosphocytidyl-2-C-methyl-D-erythritol kinase